MKKALMVSVALLVLVLAFAGSADARCGVGCLNHKVKKLTTSLKQAEQAITAQNEVISQQSQAITAANAGQAKTAKEMHSLVDCLAEVPLTQYGQPDGPLGYVVKYEDEGIEKDGVTTALDVTYSGDGVGAWALIDSCNTTDAVSASSRTALAPTVDLRSLLQPQLRLP